MRTSQHHARTPQHPPSPHTKALLPDEVMFVQEFLQNGGNASKAYAVAKNKDLKWSGLASASGRYRHRPRIAAAIEAAKAISAAALDKAFSRYVVDQDALAEKMARLAFTEMRQVVNVWSTLEPGKDGKLVRRQHMEVLDFKDIDADAHQAIVKVRKDASGGITVELADKRAAMMDIARIKGWVADKPVEMQQLVALKIER